MFGIILQSFNLVGHVIKKEIEIENFKERAPWEEIAKSGTERICAPISSITPQSFNLVGHVMTEEIEKTELLRRTDTRPKMT